MQSDRKQWIKVDETIAWNFMAFGWATQGEKNELLHCVWETEFKKSID